MSEQHNDIYDVAVVGFGPVGALLANLLGMDGVRTVVLEREPEVYRLPRAVHFDHEIMRIFQSVGLTEEMLGDTASVEAYEFWNGDRQLLFRFNLGQSVTDQGWRQDYMFHQPALEGALRAAASRRANVSVHLRDEVIEQREHDDHVEVDVRDLTSGAMRTVRARYVVGCDGANSAVRKRAGIALDDLRFDEPWLVVDASIDGPRTTLGLPAAAVQLCDPARPVSFIPVAGPYIRWEFMLRPGETQEEMLRPERVDELIAKWVDPRHVNIIRTAVYDFHALVARRWQTRRILLAGDSAHQMPPFLGQGMCSGIRDAANLAWKLALVLRGAAGESILSTYQSERDPHVRAIIDVAIGMGRIICTQDPAAAAARDAEFLCRAEREPAAPDLPGIGPGMRQSASDLAGKLGLQARVRRSDGAAALLDDVVGPGFALLLRGGQLPTLGPRAETVRASTGTHLIGIDAALDVDGAYHAWFDRHACDAVLVRPDHVVFGTATGDDAAARLFEELGEHLASSEAAMAANERE